MRVEYCPTNSMLADFLTKPLQGSAFLRLRQHLLNLPSFAPSALSSSEQQECVGASGSGSGSLSSSDTLAPKSKFPSISDQALVTSTSRHKMASATSHECPRHVSLMTSSHVITGCPSRHPMGQIRMFHDDQLPQISAVIKERASFGDVLCSS